MLLLLSFDLHTYSTGGCSITFSVYVFTSGIFSFLIFLFLVTVLLFHLNKSLSISCKAGLVVTDFFSFCLSGTVSLLPFWMEMLLDRFFLVLSSLLSVCWIYHANPFWAPLQAPKPRGPAHLEGQDGSNFRGASQDKKFG